jgi:hypothetical protein
MLTIQFAINQRGLKLRLLFHLCETKNGPKDQMVLLNICHHSLKPPQSPNSKLNRGTAQLPVQKH